MPRRTSNYPPTPAASTDITGKPDTNIVQLDSTFALPPAAMKSSRSSVSSYASHTTDSSYVPISPPSPRQTAPTTRKRSKGQVDAADYSLPPPPMRPRKIIQMDPQKAQQSKAAATSAKDAPAGSAGNKKKQGASTAQGRKIARKTAHSLIERRRRSKINEEFGILKEMIPGCEGQDMHKLSILQASIEYMRYLEKCVSDLKSVRRAHEESTPISSPKDRPYPTEPITRREEYHGVQDEENEDEDDTRDKEMEDMSDQPPPEPSPAIYPSDRIIHSATTSPNIFAQGDRDPSHTASLVRQQSDIRRFSIVSSVASNLTSPLILPSNQASPAVGPQGQYQYNFPAAPARNGSLIDSAGPSSALTSPALGPQAHHEDQLATEALLMLNSDRRNWSDLGKRGMSVKDLLSG